MGLAAGGGDRGVHGGTDRRALGRRRPPAVRRDLRQRLPPGQRGDRRRGAGRCGDPDPVSPSSDRLAVRLGPARSRRRPAAPRGGRRGEHRTTVLSPAGRPHRRRARGAARLLLRAGPAGRAAVPRPRRPAAVAAVASRPGRHVGRRGPDGRGHDPVLRLGGKPGQSRRARDRSAGDLRRPDRRRGQPGPADAPGDRNRPPAAALDRRRGRGAGRRPIGGGGHHGGRCRHPGMGHRAAARRLPGGARRHRVRRAPLPALRHRPADRRLGGGRGPGGPGVGRLRGRGRSRRYVSPDHRSRELALLRRLRRRGRGPAACSSCRAAACGSARPWPAGHVLRGAEPVHPRVGRLRVGCTVPARRRRGCGPAGERPVESCRAHHAGRRGAAGQLAVEVAVPVTRARSKRAGRPGAPRWSRAGPAGAGAVRPGRRYRAPAGHGGGPGGADGRSRSRTPGWRTGSASRPGTSTGSTPRWPGPGLG